MMAKVEDMPSDSAKIYYCIAKAYAS